MLEIGFSFPTRSSSFFNSTTRGGKLAWFPENHCWLFSRQRGIVQITNAMAKNTDPNSQSYKASSSSSIRDLFLLLIFSFIIFIEHFFCFYFFFVHFFFHLLFKMKNEHTFRLLSLVNKRLQCGTSKTLKAYSESAAPSEFPHSGRGGATGRAC